MKIGKYVILRIAPIIEGNEDFVRLLKSLWPMQGTGITISLSELQNMLQAGTSVTVLEMEVNGEPILTIEARP